MVKTRILMRGYPGPLPTSSFLSKSSSERILGLLNKDNIITTQFPLLQVENIVHNTYNLYGKDRKGFFKAIRKVAIDNDINISTIATNESIFYSTINRMANIAYKLKKPNKDSDLYKVPDLYKAFLEKSESSIKYPKGLSLEQKREIFTKTHNTMTTKMTLLQENYENNKTINWDIITQWIEYLDNRGTVEPNYTSQEKQINIFLKHLLAENTESRDVLLSRVEDKLLSLKLQSTLPNKELLEKTQGECFTEQDYVEKINAIKKTLDILQTDKSLSNQDLILLAIWSEAALLDEESTPKLQREVYTLANKYPEEFGIKHTGKKPDYEEIMEALKNKNYFIKQSSENIPEGGVISTAPLLHKTVIIPTKQGLYYTGMFTSSKTDTQLLSTKQECNFDPEEREKEQRFTVFSNFVLCEDKEIIVDLLALGFIHAKNIDGEDVHKKLIGIYENNKEKWENNFVQELFIITPEVLKKIAIKFNEKNLEMIEKKCNDLVESLENETEEQREVLRSKFLEKKENKVKEQEDQKYFSKLSLNFQKLLSSINHFEKDVERQKAISVIREEKNILTQKAEENKLLLQREKEGRQRTGQLTARERREAIQKRIEDSKKGIENNPSNTESAPKKQSLLIEDKKST